MAGTVLIAGGDEKLRDTLSRAVRSAGLEVCTMARIAEVPELVRTKHVDLILLEAGLPAAEGFQVLETLRSRGIRLPIIVLGDHMADHDILYALDIGADDCVSRPLNPVLLAARAKALIRRSRGCLSDQAVITAGPFRYDTTTLRFYKNGLEIPLSARENALMKLFLSNGNRVFPRALLYELIWGETIVDENAVMVYISRLRRKIEDDPAQPRYLETVRGLGYRFVV